MTEKEALRYINVECNKALESLAFKCRREQPCHVTSVAMDISFPNDDEVQLLVSAMATKMAPSNESPLEQSQMESPFESQQVWMLETVSCRLTEQLYFNLFCLSHSQFAA